MEMRLHRVEAIADTRWFEKAHWNGLCRVIRADMSVKDHAEELYKIKQTDLIRRRQIPEHSHIRHIVDDLLGHLRALAEVIP